MIGRKPAKFRARLYSGSRQSRREVNSTKVGRVCPLPTSRAGHTGKRGETRHVHAGAVASCHAPQIGRKPDILIFAPVFRAHRSPPKRGGRLSGSCRLGESNEVGTSKGQGRQANTLARVPQERLGAPGGARPPVPSQNVGQHGAIYRRRVDKGIRRRYRIQASRVQWATLDRAFEVGGHWRGVHGR